MSAEEMSAKKWQPATWKPANERRCGREAPPLDAVTTV